jgi:hypothetical protein
MATKQASIKRVVMAKMIAQQWLERQTRPEYRLRVYYAAREIRGLPALLRSFRDGKLKMGSINPIPDLGVKEDFDSFTVWSSDREGLQELQKWFETRGCETTGVW